MDLEHVKSVLAKVDRDRVLARLCVLLRTNKISIETFVRKRKLLLQLAGKKDDAYVQKD
jgi:hypothetical protein